MYIVRYTKYWKKNASLAGSSFSDLMPDVFQMNFRSWISGISRIAGFCAIFAGFSAKQISFLRKLLNYTLGNQSEIFFI